MKIYYNNKVQIKELSLSVLNQKQPVRKMKRFTEEELEEKKVILQKKNNITFEKKFWK